MNIPYVFKRCTKCGEYKVANTEYFHKYKASKDGLKPKCKVCRSKEAKKGANNKKYKKIKINSKTILLVYNKRDIRHKKDIYYRKNIETGKYEIAKKCTDCGKVKLITTEYFHKDRNNTLKSYCKECGKKKAKEYAQNNPEKEKARSSKYRQSERGKKKIKEYNQSEKGKARKKAWKQSPKGKASIKRDNQSEKGKARKKRYEQTEKAHIAKFNNECKRRAKEQSQGNGITVEQWQEMNKFFNWRCAYSGILLKPNNRSKDHITPLNLGGENEIWNLVPMFRNYNSSKNDKEMLEWYKEQPFYSEDRLKKIYEWQEYAYNKYYEEIAYCTK